MVSKSAGKNKIFRIIEISYGTHMYCKDEKAARPRSKGKGNNSYYVVVKWWLNMKY